VLFRSVEFFSFVLFFVLFLEFGSFSPVEAFSSHNVGLMDFEGPDLISIF